MIICLPKKFNSNLPMLIMSPEMTLKFTEKIIQFYVWDVIQKAIPIETIREMIINF